MIVEDFWDAVKVAIEERQVGVDAFEPEYAQMFKKFMACLPDKGLGDT